MRKVRVAPKGMGLNDFVAQQEFDDPLEQVKRRDLDQYLKEKSFHKLTYRV